MAWGGEALAARAQLARSPPLRVSDRRASHSLRTLHPESLSLSVSLSDAVLCELSMIASGQPCLTVGDLHIEPSKIPCLLKGISAGLWFDLHASRAVASGAIPAATCMHYFYSTGGTRRDFIIGCPLAASALSWCRVLGERWVLPHHAVLRASFGLGAWTSRSRQVALYTALWLASWVFFFLIRLVALSLPQFVVCHWCLQGVHWGCL